MDKDERIERIKLAMGNYVKRNSPIKKRSKPNQKPEKDVVRFVLVWLKANGFDCHVVESKAVYSRSAGRYLRGQTDPGVSDIIGCTPSGVACFIEVKAPGRITNLSLHQKVFLSEKAKKGCFAVCVDSVERLEAIYKHWTIARDTSVALSHQYLLGLLGQIE